MSKTDQVKEAILDDIRSGIYKAGDELPSIRRMCLLYKMSKHTISQALSVLAENGVIEVSHGKISRIAGSRKKKIFLVYANKTSIEVQEFWSEFYRGVKSALEEYPDYELEIIHVAFEGEGGLKRTFSKCRPEAVLLFGSVFADLAVPFITQLKIPAVSVYDVKRHNNVQVLAPDFYPAVSQMVKLFLARGAKKIACLSSCLEGGSATVDGQKIETLKRVLAEHKMNFKKDFQLNVLHHRMEDAYELSKNLFSQKDTPDALFLSSDIFAPAVYRAAYECGINVPDKLKIAACDNLAIGKMMIPALSTIELNRKEQGETALKMLLAKLKQNSKMQDKQFIPTLIMRESLCLA